MQTKSRQKTATGRSNAKVGNRRTRGSHSQSPDQPSDSPHSDLPVTPISQAVARDTELMEGALMSNCVNGQLVGGSSVVHPGSYDEDILPSMPGQAGVSWSKTSVRRAQRNASTVKEYLLGEDSASPVAAVSQLVTPPPEDCESGVKLDEGVCKGFDSGESPYTMCTSPHKAVTAADSVTTSSVRDLGSSYSQNTLLAAYNAPLAPAMIQVAMTNGDASTTATSPMLRPSTDVYDFHEEDTSNSSVSQSHNSSVQSTPTKTPPKKRVRSREAEFFTEGQPAPKSKPKKSKKTAKTTTYSVSVPVQQLQQPAELLQMQQAVQQSAEQLQGQLQLQGQQLIMQVEQQQQQQQQEVRGLIEAENLVAPPSTPPSQIVSLTDNLRTWSKQAAVSMSLVSLQSAPSSVESSTSGTAQYYISPSNTKSPAVLSLSPPDKLDATHQLAATQLHALSTPSNVVPVLVTSQAISSLRQPHTTFSQPLLTTSAHVSVCSPQSTVSSAGSTKCQSPGNRTAHKTAQPHSPVCTDSEQVTENVMKLLRAARIAMGKEAPGSNYSEMELLEKLRGKGEQNQPVSKKKSKRSRSKEAKAIASPGCVTAVDMCVRGTVVKSDDVDNAAQYSANVLESGGEQPPEAVQNMVQTVQASTSAVHALMHNAHVTDTVDAGAKPKPKAKKRNRKKTPAESASPAVATPVSQLPVHYPISSSVQTVTSVEPTQQAELLCSEKAQPTQPATILQDTKHILLQQAALQQAMLQLQQHGTLQTQLLQQDQAQDLSQQLQMKTDKAAENLEAQYQQLMMGTLASSASATPPTSLPLLSPDSTLLAGYRQADVASQPTLSQVSPQDFTPTDLSLPATQSQLALELTSQNSKSQASTATLSKDQLLLRGNRSAIADLLGIQGDEEVDTNSLQPSINPGMAVPFSPPPVTFHSPSALHSAYPLLTDHKPPYHNTHETSTSQARNPPGKIVKDEAFPSGPRLPTSDPLPTDDLLQSDAMQGVSKELMERLQQNLVEEVPHCDCFNGEVSSEEKEGPYYTHLGVAPDIPHIRSTMEDRLGVKGEALRIEKVLYTGKEGKSPQGCPVAKWILRRSGPDEKFMVVVRKRRGHSCKSAVLVIGIVMWEGVPEQQSAELYDYLRKTIPQHGLETERRCGTNEKRNCACQGWNGNTGGASFSFGCSWSMYYNGCKFARSCPARKFKLRQDAETEEPVLEHHLQKLATHINPVAERVVPQAYSNMTLMEGVAADCRLGYKRGRPFSGVTTVVDYCCHAHKDQQNMNNGCTVVLTLTKHRGFEKPDDEQLHVLPLCVLDSTDEHDSVDNQYAKVRSGAIEWLTKYPMTMRIRAFPKLKKKKNCKGVGRGRGKGRGLAQARATSRGRATSHWRSAGRSPWGRYPRSPWAGGSRGFRTQSRSFFWNARSKHNPNVSSHIPSVDYTQGNSHYAMNKRLPKSLDGKKFRSRKPRGYRLQPAYQSHLDQVARPAWSGLPKQPIDNTYTSQAKHEVKRSDGAAYGVPPHSQLTSPHHQPKHNLHTPTTDAMNCQSSLGSEREMPESSHQLRGWYQKWSDDGALNSSASTTGSGQGKMDLQASLREFDDILKEKGVKKNPLFDYVNADDPDWSRKYEALYNKQEDSAPREYPAEPSLHSPSAFRPPDALTQSSGLYTASDALHLVPGAQLNTLTKHVADSLACAPRQHLSGSLDSVQHSPLSGSQATPKLSPKWTAVPSPAYTSTDWTGASPQLSPSNPPSYLQHSKMTKLPPPPSYEESSRSSAVLSRPPSQEMPSNSWNGSQLPLDGSYPYTAHGTTPGRQDKGLVLLSQAAMMQTDQQNYTIPAGYQAVNTPQTQSRNPKVEDGSQPNGKWEEGEGSSQWKEPMVDAQGDSLEGAREVPTDNEHNFRQNDIGGVAIALQHGSLLFEVAKRELHATTAVKCPSREDPTRISLVFYQHKSLNLPHHGHEEFRRKNKLRQEKREAKQQEEQREAIKQGHQYLHTPQAAEAGRTDDEKMERAEDETFVAPVYRCLWETTVQSAATNTTPTMTTKWIQPRTAVTGPYQRWM